MRKIALLVIFVFASVAFSETKKLPVTSDVGICAHRNEVRLNTGGNSRVRIKGNEHYYLFNFDTKAIRNWKITGATLHLKLARGHLRKVAFCTVPGKWVEGTAVNKPQKGSTCFTHVQYPKIKWRPYGGTMLDATFNSPYMMWRTSDVKYQGKWMEIPIAPELVQAVAAGLSHGLVMSDEKGQTRENHDVYTREQDNAKPYLVVEGKPHHVAIGLKRPAAKTSPYKAGGDFQRGAIRIDTSWPGKKVLGSRVRIRQYIGTMGYRLVDIVTFSDPVVILPTRPVNKGDFKWSVQVETYIGPQMYARSDDWKESSKPLAIPKVPKIIWPKRFSLAGMAPGWSRLRRLVCEKPLPDLKGFRTRKPTSFLPLITPRNAWVGTQVVILPQNGKAENVTVELTELKDARLKRARTFPPLKHVKLYRVWYVPKGKQYHAELLVPLKTGQKFNIPWKQNKVPQQAGQAIFVDVWVPKSTMPGVYEGKLVIRQGGKSAMSVPVRVRVSSVTLPDKFNIVGDMNTYGSPARAMGAKTSDAKSFMETEQKYYRLAHTHRMTLSALPYTQRGNIGWRGAPKLKTGIGPTWPYYRIVDWSDWDERFGPLLSGKAFTKKHGYIGPGEGVAIRHMYLPFHENWPVPLSNAFKPWPPPKDYKKFLQWSADLPPLEKCIGRGMHWWNSTVNAFAGHIITKGWFGTQYQVYLNNKYYFRDSKRYTGQGISLWLLDEPMFVDDFLALRYFGSLLRNALSVRYFVRGQENIKFRIDISRPTHQRNFLDGLVKLNVCAGQLYSQRRLIEYRKRKFSEEYWNYQMPPSFTKDNLAWSIWPIRSFCWSATGTLVWQTIGSDGDIYKSDPTALMYPGRKFGLDRPVPSMRMKAWRDGIQIAEMLRMLKIKRKWNNIQLRAFVGQVCNLDGWEDGMFTRKNAPIVTFNKCIPQTLDTLKRAILQELSD